MGKGWWLGVSLPTTVTINTGERDQNPFTNLTQILSCRGSQVTLGSILGQVLVGQRASLALHGTGQIERVRLSSKQWILGVTREGKSVSGASMAKVLPTNQDRLLERVGVFSPEKRMGEEWFGTPVAPNGRTEAIDEITGRKIPIHQSQTYLII